MKRLYLIRHAKSSWENPLLNDFDRPLNKRGMRDAPRMAKRLKEKDICPDLIITSPAIRTLSTCNVLASMLGFPHESVVKEKQLYHADEDHLFEILQRTPGHYKNVFMIGHNPGLSNFANELTVGSNFQIPTCGVVGLAFALDDWHNIAYGMGKLLFFIYPKQEAP
jgi:phosphohistidine phosphatase